MIFAIFFSTINYPNAYELISIANSICGKTIDLMNFGVLQLDIHILL